MRSGSLKPVNNAADLTQEGRAVAFGSKKFLKRILSTRPPLDREDRASGRDDPHVVLQLGRVFFRRRFLRERPRKHEFRFEYRAAWLDKAARVGAHPPNRWVSDQPLDVRDDLTLFASYHRRLSSSATIPSWTTRLPDRSLGSTSPRWTADDLATACALSVATIRPAA
jgi:hypothetical protein